MLIVSPYGVLIFCARTRFTLFSPPPFLVAARTLSPPLADSSPFLLGLSLSSLSLPPLPSSEHRVRTLPSILPFSLSAFHSLRLASSQVLAPLYFALVFLTNLHLRLPYLSPAVFFVMSHCRNVPLSFSNGGPHYPFIRFVLFLLYSLFPFVYIWTIHDCGAVVRAILHLDHASFFICNKPIPGVSNRD